MAIPVKIPVFDGPLDLLLHLIDKNKVDIYDIPIALITDQYLEYVQQMDREDMNITSEFMVMAATLIDLKCRMLLPVESEEAEEDPREELVARLLEYKKYKYMSSELRDKSADAGEIVIRPQKLPKEVLAYREPVDIDALLNGVTLESLQKVLESVLKRRADRIDPVRSRFGQIEKDEISLPEVMTNIERTAVRKRRVTFRSLLEEQKSRPAVVAAFLAILELMKLGKIRIVQERLFGEIDIESLEPEGTEVKQFEEGETY